MLFLLALNKHGSVLVPVTPLLLYFLPNNARSVSIFLFNLSLLSITYYYFGMIIMHIIYIRYNILYYVLYSTTIYLQFENLMNGKQMSNDILDLKSMYNICTTHNLCMRCAFHFSFSHLDVTLGVVHV